MEIRKYQERDKKNLVALWSSVFPDDPPHNEPSKVINEKLAIDDLIFLAESNSILVGACMAGYDGHRGWLYAVAVQHSERRKGVGASLVQFAMQSLKELGCIKVNLQIRDTNKDVSSFYQSLGFSIEPRISMGAFIE